MFIFAVLTKIIIQGAERVSKRDNCLTNSFCCFNLAHSYIIINQPWICKNDWITLRRNSILDNYSVTFFGRFASRIIGYNKVKLE